MTLLRRPHTGAYCSVQTVGRPASESVGTSCAITIPADENASKDGTDDGGGVEATRAANTAAHAMVMAITPSKLGEFLLCRLREGRGADDSPGAIRPRARSSSADTRAESGRTEWVSSS